MQLLMSMPDFANPAIWFSLLTLTFLEIVLGIDNIIFISIATSNLAREEKKKATQIGLMLAMVLRIILLFGINILISMEKPWFEISTSFMHGAFSGQSVILLLGGLFLLYKATSEIHHKLEGDSDHDGVNSKTSKSSLSNVILQITLINIVFSFDSILTAVGMTTGMEGALVIMIIAVVLSVLIMMGFAVPVGNFVNEHPTIQMLGLSFLILIGFVLISEACHMANLDVFGASVGTVPKGYLYFAIGFSLLVEFLNIRLRKKQKPVQLHGYQEEALQEGIKLEE
jgi:predicted tellurium resistance membrane protein TerC